MIHQRIKLLRIKLNFTQKETSNILCMSQAAYAKLENGITKIDTERLLLISKTFGTNPLDLLYGENERLTLSRNIKYKDREISSLRKQLKKLTSYPNISKQL